MIQWSVLSKTHKSKNAFTVEKKWKLEKNTEKHHVLKNIEISSIAYDYKALSHIVVYIFSCVGLSQTRLMSGRFLCQCNKGKTVTFFDIKKSPNNWMKVKIDYVILLFCSTILFLVNPLLIHWKRMEDVCILEQLAAGIGRDRSFRKIC
jgi:hypothetical protein